MLVVHGRWELDRLLVWAEGTPAATPRRTTSRAVRTAPTHPFTVPASALATALTEVAALNEPPDLGEVVLDLPSRDGAPLPSPDVPESVGDDIDGGSPARQAVRMARWRVPVVRLDAREALNLVGTLRAGPAGAGEPGELAPGGDLRHLATLAAFADDLAGRGRVLPGLRTEPAAPKPRGTPRTRARACWRPVLTGADAQRARDLALALPPVARGEGATAAGTLADALDALTDAAVRDRAQASASGSGRTTTARTTPRGSAPGAHDLASAWRTALLGDDPWLPGSARELDALAGRLRAWQAEAASGPVRALFRLVEPPVGDADEEPEEAGGRGGRGRPGGQADRWTVTFGLQAADEPSLTVDAERVWGAKRRLAAFARFVPDPQETLLKELGRAMRLYPGLAPALRTARPTSLELDSAGAHAFLRDAAPSLAAAGFGVLLPSWWGRPGARLGVRAKASTPSQPGATDGRPAFGQEALVDFRWEVALGDTALTPEELTALADLQAPLVRVRGQWVELDAQRLRNGLQLVRDNAGRLSLGELLRVVGTGEGGPGGLPVVGVAADGWLGELLSGTASVGVEPVRLPAGFDGTLRPYQVRGLAWLTFLQHVGLGAVLADDMGLGKTVQLLALLAGDPNVASGRSGETGEQAMDADGEPGPTLLVCPMSLVGNWQREAARFTPGLSVHVHHGAERPRGAAFRDAVAAADLVITTYALAARDAAALSQVRWRRVVLDEAQAVKNAATRAAVAVRGLPATHRIAMTGTPVENRLADLWALMEFANPGLLGNATAFKQRFARPIERHADPDATARLRAVTQPFILRRLKTDRDIIADLPEKLEMEVVCGLTREQAALYQSVVDDMLRRVAGSEGMERRGLVLATMTKLKQVCNHPAQFLRDGSRMSGRSGKLERLEETLEEVFAGGEKALLFTQYAEFGAMLRGHLSARFGTEVLYLHGGVAKADRDAMVTRFQSGAPGSPPLFVLSLKAGGTGLTLTEANHVIHVDRWWNPAVEDQATDRAYRIGQTRGVQVRKLVCGGTLEERIAEMIRDKRGLAASVVGTGEAWLTELTTDQLRELIRLDADSVVE